MSESIKDMTGGWSDNRMGGWLRRLLEAAKTELDALRTLTSELRTDHATQKTSYDACVTLIDELADDQAVNKTLTDELVVDNDAAVADISALRAAIVGITAKLDLDAGVTDTDYASLWDPASQTSTTIAAAKLAALTASKPAAGPASLSAAAAVETLTS